MPHSFSNYWQLSERYLRLELSYMRCAKCRFAWLLFAKLMQYENKEGGSGSRYVVFPSGKLRDELYNLRTRG